MLQENSFFSRPFIFFGENVNEKEIDEDEEWDLIDPWTISLEAHSSSQLVPPIGLFLHWSDLSE